MPDTGEDACTDLQSLKHREKHGQYLDMEKSEGTT